MDNTSKEKIKTVKQEQVQNLLFNREVDWQEIIYDLINTEQLDPWDVDIVKLTDKYIEKIHHLEETDFFVSSKVLFAAALLLRIKSEVLLKKYIKSIDEILFGEKEQDKKIGLERIELDEEIPGLNPRSPIPRFRKVTLQELMQSLNKAIATENRRIKKVTTNTNAIRESSYSLPKRKFSIKDKIKEIYEKLYGHLKEDKKKNKISFSEFAGNDKEERIISFSSLLHLDHQKKVWLDQEKHFDEFYIWLKEVYFANNPDPFADLKFEVEEQTKEMSNEEKKRLEKVNKDFENPLGEMAES